MIGTCPDLGKRRLGPRVANRQYHHAALQKRLARNYRPLRIAGKVRIDWPGAVPGSLRPRSCSRGSASNIEPPLCLVLAHIDIRVVSLAGWRHQINRIFIHLAKVVLYEDRNRTRRNLDPNLLSAGGVAMRLRDRPGLEHHGVNALSLQEAVSCRKDAARGIVPMGVLFASGK